jgi:hypothetical protein
MVMRVKKPAQFSSTQKDHMYHKNEWQINMNSTIGLSIAGSMNARIFSLER